MKGRSVVRESIYELIDRERDHQDQKWGQQDHPPLKWIAIIAEELGEASKGALELPYLGHILEDYSGYLDELIEVAASSVAALECLARIIEI